MGAERNPGMHSDQAHLLNIYLRDHEAAAVGGLELFRRCSKANRGSEYAAELQRLTIDVRSNRDALRRFCRMFGVRYSKVGRAVAYTGAIVGRVKPNGRLIHYSPLSRVLELEALSSAVTSQLRLWESLLRLSVFEPRLDETELTRLVAAANAQLEALRHLHDAAAEEAFK